LAWFEGGKGPKSGVGASDNLSCQFFSSSFLYFRTFRREIKKNFSVFIVVLVEQKRASGSLTLFAISDDEREATEKMNGSKIWNKQW
jgi:hypothetical protein